MPQEKGELCLCTAHIYFFQADGGVGWVSRFALFWGLFDWVFLEGWCLSHFLVIKNLV